MVNHMTKQHLEVAVSEGGEMRRAEGDMMSDMMTLT